MLWSRCRLTDDLERWVDPPYIFLPFSCQPTTYRQQCPCHFHSWPILPIPCSAQGQYCELNSSTSNLFTFSLKDQEWRSSGRLDWTRPNSDWMPVVEMGSCSEVAEVCSTLPRPSWKTLVMSRRLTTPQSKYRQHVSLALDRLILQLLSCRRLSQNLMWTLLPHPTPQKPTPTHKCQLAHQTPTPTSPTPNRWHQSHDMSPPLNGQLCHAAIHLYSIIHDIHAAAPPFNNRHVTVLSSINTNRYPCPVVLSSHISRGMNNAHCLTTATSLCAYNTHGCPWPDIYRINAPQHCYGTVSCLLSYLINHASPILSNELSNTSVWMLWNSFLFNLLHFIIVWSCGHYYKVWQLLGITPHCWLNAKPLLHTAYTQTLFLFSQTIFLHSYFLICSFFHTLSSYLLIFLSLTHLIAGLYSIGGYLDYILLDDKPGLV